MATVTPNGTGINWLALTNPQAAAQQIQIQRQNQIAQQLMDQGGEQQNPNQLANPGGLVVPVSPWAAAGKALEKGLGGYMQSKADSNQMDMYKQLAASGQAQSPATNPQFGAALPWSGGMTSDDAQTANQSLAQALQDKAQMPQSQGPNTQTAMGDPQFMKDAMIVGPEEAYKGFLARTSPTDMAKNAGNPITAPYLAKDALITLPDGTPVPANRFLSPAQPSAQSPAPPPPVPMTAENAAKMESLYGSGQESPETNAMPNTPDTSKIQAADGKPLLPNVSQLPMPDPTGMPKFKYDNTKPGVEQSIQDQKDAAEGNKAFATTAQSLSQEQSRINNLIQIYKDVQSGTLTAQNPELFNKLAALGFHDSPQNIHDLAGVQNATQNHILQVIQQIKDTNANAGGGAPTRVFGSEIKELLDNGESAKSQPEALWNVIGQAKGLVDHHLDMVKGWNAIGGLGNRAAGGYTMRPDDYAQQFNMAHDISDYRDSALKSMGPFKGMPGNNGATPAPAGRVKVQTPDGKIGTVDASHVQELLGDGGKVLQ